MQPADAQSKGIPAERLAHGPSQFLLAEGRLIVVSYQNLYLDNMKENDKNQAQEFRLPPTWCGSLCRNAMNQICVESCAIKRDCSAFEIRTDLNLEEMPPMPDIQ